MEFDVVIVGGGAYNVVNQLLDGKLPSVYCKTCDIKDSVQNISLGWCRKVAVDPVTPICKRASVHTVVQKEVLHGELGDSMRYM